MNDWEIADIEDVFRDQISSEMELYSTMPDKDENTFSEKNEEDKSENAEGVAKEDNTEVEESKEEEEVTEAASKDIGSETSEVVEEKLPADETPKEESVETVEVPQEQSPSEPAEEDSAAVEESKEEVEIVEEAREDTADKTGEQAEEASPEVKMDPEEVAKMAMQTRIVQATYTDMRNDLPRFRSGDKISVGYRVIEGSRSRVQIFEGVVIKISSGHGLDKTFTVRKISGGIGVERIFPFHSPNIESIKVLKEGKVRRAKLFYLRSRKGKATRIKERT